MKWYNLVSQKLYGYFTGQSADRQVILGFHLPGLLAVFFDKDGMYRDVLERSFSTDLLAEWSNPPYDPWNPSRELRCKGFQELRCLADEITFREGPISILPFNLMPAHQVYLDPVPETYRDILENPEHFTEEEREQAADWCATLDDNSFFAFSWSYEYLMNSDGTVNSS
jgi:hypothetical protein